MICLEFCGAGRIGEFKLSDINVPPFESLGVKLQNILDKANQSQFNTPHQVETIYVNAAISAREFLQSVIKKNPVWAKFPQLAPLHAPKGLS
jgi:hypothetical protein